MTDETVSPNLDVTMGVDIPLPPAELADALDNSSSASPTSAPVEVTPVQPMAVLDFLGGVPGVTIPLLFPFRFNGREVREVRVRPLAVVEMGQVARAHGAGADNYVFYAAMTGLPAEVLRALPGQDGERVTDAAYGFLPRYLTGEDYALPSRPSTGAS